MIVLEGKNGKILKINEFLNYNKSTKNIKTLLISKNNINNLIIEDCDHVIIENENYEMFKNEINNYQFLILYLNCKNEEIDDIKNKFKWFNGPILLTIQNNDLENLEIYKI